MRILLLLLLISTQGLAQVLAPVKVCDLPAELEETSGLLKVGSNQFISHTDSGNEPILYVFDSSGSIQRRVRITNANNVDWEEITQDNKGNIFVGDFGNNNNNRQDLKIYIVPNISNHPYDTIAARVMQFSYPDQKAFPPALTHQNFDMEAFFWFNNFLYLFSKNRTNPFTGYTKCYRIPAVAGTFTATLIDSFYTGGGGFLNYSITGAAIFPSASKMILLGNDKCWMFSDFIGHNFFKGKLQTFSFPTLSQREAICFENANTLWFSQEKSVLSGAGLYKFTLPAQTTNSLKKYLQSNYQLYPNPAEDSFFIQVHESIEEPDMLLEILDINGKKVGSEYLLMETKNEVKIKHLAPGTYYLRVNGMRAGEIVKR
ncbi:MAG: T9SS type A sorting domain-containing protein [Bacteroidota bacterium]|nr:T9SS type A sorting domain-containing protein [Bacteroidota bacterium]